MAMARGPTPSTLSGKTSSSTTLTFRRHRYRDRHRALLQTTHRQRQLHGPDQSDTDTHSDPVTDTHSDPVTDTHSDPVTDTDSDPVTDTHFDPVTDTHSDPDADSHSDPITDSHSDFNSDRDHQRATALSPQDQQEERQADRQGGPIRFHTRLRHHAFNSASASNAANYQIDTITTKKVKRKKETVLQPITTSTVAYLAASDAVEITFGANETFSTGGQITVLGGLTTAAGGTLTGSAVFTIAKGGQRVRPS